MRRNSAATSLNTCVHYNPRLHRHWVQSPVPISRWSFHDHSKQTTINQERPTMKRKTEVGIIIESGIAIPRVRQQEGKWRHIVLSMNYGDSVLLPRKESQCLKQAIRLHGDNAVGRTEDGQIRVWKVKKP